MTQKTLLKVLLSIIMLTSSVFAKTYDLKDGQSIYGDLEFRVYKGEKDLFELARHYDVAYDVLLAANPGLDKGEESWAVSLFCLQSSCCQMFDIMAWL